MEEITVVSKVSKRSRSIKIEVKTSGVVVLTRPRYVSEKNAFKFLEEKKSWIIDSYKKMIENMPKKMKYEDNDIMYYLGNPYTLKINEVIKLNKINQTQDYILKKTTKSIVVLDKTNNTIEIYIKEKYNSNENIKNEILNFLANEAYINIKERLDIYSKQMNLQYNMFRIKDTKTRWGSCSSKKNLNFNYKLIFAPQWIIDYVIIHELSHLKHMDHSKNFWSLVGMYAPKYKEAKKWFKDNSNVFNV